MDQDLPPSGSPTVKPASNHPLRLDDQSETLLGEVKEFLAVALRDGGTAVLIAKPEHVAQLAPVLQPLYERRKMPEKANPLVVIDAADILSHVQRRDAELTDFVENAADGLHRVAGNGIILWANRAELELLGYDEKDYVGKHIADFHVDAPVINNILTALSAGETLRDYPARLRCADGSIKHVLINSNGCFEGF